MREDIMLHQRWHRLLRRMAFLFLAVVLALTATDALTADNPPAKWVQATAYAIPKETTSEGSGYFAIVPGHNDKLYIGTAKYRQNAYLVEFDTKTKEMKVVVDAQKEIG